jgi:hypothetical protein
MVGDGAATSGYRHVSSVGQGEAVTITSASLVASAREGSGLATVYQALDDLVDLYSLDDAAVVVDVPGFGRQVLHAGRRPLRDDEADRDHAGQPSQLQLELVEAHDLHGVVATPAS